MVISVGGEAGDGELGDSRWWELRRNRGADRWIGLVPRPQPRKNCCTMDLWISDKQSWCMLQGRISADFLPPPGFLSSTTPSTYPSCPMHLYPITHQFKPTQKSSSPMLLLPTISLSNVMKHLHHLCTIPVIIAIPKTKGKNPSLLIIEPNPMLSKCKWKRRPKK